MQIENSLVKTDMDYKGIVHERLGEAPFIGALILANDCPYKCKGCFNQYLKTKPTLQNSAKEIIDMIKQNPFNEGIILGGLEWTYQPKDMLHLVNIAQENNLKVMIFTHMYKDEFLSKFSQLINSNIIVKFGGYEEDKLNTDYQSKGVRLASTNQYVEVI